MIALANEHTTLCILKLFRVHGIECQHNKWPYDTFLSSFLSDNSLPSCYILQQPSTVYNSLYALYFSPLYFCYCCSLHLADFYSVL